MRNVHKEMEFKIFFVSVKKNGERHLTSRSDNHVISNCHSAERRAGISESCRHFLIQLVLKHSAKSFFQELQAWKKKLRQKLRLIILPSVMEGRSEKQQQQQKRGRQVGASSKHTGRWQRESGRSEEAEVVGGGLWELRSRL